MGDRDLFSVAADILHKGDDVADLICCIAVIHLVADDHVSDGNSDDGAFFTEFLDDGLGDFFGGSGLDKGSGENAAGEDTEN